MSAAPPKPASFRVQVFARYTELLGGEYLAIPADGIRTVADLLSKIRALPGGALLRGSILVAVNLRQAGPDVPIGPDDEIALLPPLAGG